MPRHAWFYILAGINIASGIIFVILGLKMLPIVAAGVSAFLCLAAARNSEKMLRGLPVAA